MINNKKAQTFIGFAMRTGQFRIGVNAIKTIKRANLLVVCGSASENTVNDAVKLAKRFHCKLIKTQGALLEEYTHRSNAKLMAIENKELSQALLQNVGEDFIEII